NHFDEYSTCLSLFADGYLNNFLSQKEFTTFLTSKPDLRLRHLLSFCAAVYESPYDETTYDVVSAESFLSGVERCILIHNIEEVIREYIEYRANKDVLVIAFRPWAQRIHKDLSPNEHTEVIYNNVILDCVLHEAKGVGPTILFHGDNRCISASRAFLEKLKDKYDSSCILDTTNLLPSHVNMDTVLYALSKIEGFNIDVLIFDSSLAPPFVEGKLDLRFLVGVPDEVMKNYKQLFLLKKQLMRRMSYWEKYAEVSVGVNLRRESGSTYAIIEKS
nr:hypothetical protein [Methyloceanibacter sp.]